MAKLKWSARGQKPVGGDAGQVTQLFDGLPASNRIGRSECKIVHHGPTACDFLSSNICFVLEDKKSVSHTEGNAQYVLN